MAPKTGRCAQRRPAEKKGRLLGGLALADRQVQAISLHHPQVKRLLEGQTRQDDGTSVDVVNLEHFFVPLAFDVFIIAHRKGFVNPYPC